MIAAARALMDDLGLRHLRAHSSDVVVYVEMLAGDYEAAEREAGAAYAVLTEMGDRTFQAAEAHLMAMALEAQGRVDDADRWLTISGQPGEAHTIAVEAQIQARRGNLEAAERLARSALEPGDERHVPQFADPRFTLAQILARMGRDEEARQAAEQSMRRYEAKGIVPLMARALGTARDTRGAGVEHAHLCLGVPSAAERGGRSGRGCGMAGRWFGIAVVAVCLAAAAASLGTAPAPAGARSRCSPGAHALAPPGSHLYPDTGMAATPACTRWCPGCTTYRNLFLPGNRRLTDWATKAGRASASTSNAGRRTPARGRICRSARCGERPSGPVQLRPADVPGRPQRAERPRPGRA